MDFRHVEDVKLELLVHTHREAIFKAESVFGLLVVGDPQEVLMSKDEQRLQQTPESLVGVGADEYVSIFHAPDQVVFEVWRRSRVFNEGFVLKLHTQVLESNLVRVEDVGVTEFELHCPLHAPYHLKYFFVFGQPVQLAFRDEVVVASLEEQFAYLDDVGLLVAFFGLVDFFEANGVVDVFVLLVENLVDHCLLDFWERVNEESE